MTHHCDTAPSTAHHVRATRPSASEQAALDSFVSVAALFESRTPGMAGDAAPPANQRWLVRAVEGDASRYQGKTGLSADGASLIFLSQAHLYLIPMDDVLGLELLRLAPGRGAGGAFLMVSCRRADAPPLLLTITRRRAPDALSALARQLAEKLARPLVIHPVEAAC